MRPAKKNAGRVPDGEALMQRMYTRIGCEGRPPHFQVEFFPYSSLTLTIRRREDMVHVRFSDLLRHAPLEVLEGAAALLLARVYRRRVPHASVQRYLHYARSSRTRQRIHRMRGSRVRRVATLAQGRHYDLSAIFDQLNHRYFGGKLQRPHIGWSTRSWRRQFGCFDPGPRQILLNRRMDKPCIPEFVVEYVLFHEMLHVKHPTRCSGCTLLSHSPEFRAEEKRFAQFAEARKFLDRLAR